ncbi:MAG: hypothetical protein RIB69_14520 [Roseovarius sp.]|uniref:hypothetical protein n=2 Tax=Hyphomicrobiales TaxID=356 RepID=UPI0032EACCF2
MAEEKEEVKMDFSLDRMVVVDGRPSRSGNRILGVFELNIAGLQICGCSLVQRHDGKLVVNGPKGKSHRGHQIAVHISDPEIADAISVRATKVYEGLRGHPIQSTETPE